MTERVSLLLPLSYGSHVLVRLFLVLAATHAGDDDDDQEHQACADADQNPHQHFVYALSNTRSAPRR